MADSAHPPSGNENTNQGSVLGLWMKAGTAATFAGTLQIPLAASSLGAANKQSLIKMNVLSLTAETLALTGSTDGTNFSAALVPISATTGGYFSSAALSTGEYQFPSTWNFSHYKVVKSSSTDSCAVAIAYNTAPKI